MPCSACCLRRPTPALEDRGYPARYSAVGFEFLQEFSPTRHARVDDAIVKAFGALVGVAIGHLVNRTRLRRLSNA